MKYSTASAQKPYVLPAMENAQPENHLFRISDHDDFSEIHPSAYTGGPWNAAHQHGGAISALLTRSLDRIGTPAKMRLARITIDMFRGVPLTPLRIETRVVRGGRRIQSVEANLFDGDTQVARATGLRIRSDHSIRELETFPDLDPEVGRPPKVVPEFELRSGVAEIPPFVRAVELIPGRPRECGEITTTWVRLRCKVVEGEKTAPVVQLAALVDFMSGTGNVMDYTKFTSINPDLSINVLREPRSDWIGLQGVSHRSADGIGLSHATLHDLEGPIGQAQACLLLDRR
ncbi:MAG: hypothetical protein CL933_18865 [Deltaproteobacteria bacterium]|nr:hypothetical protein [Deltaproteobacteria bacterium]